MLIGVAASAGIGIGKAVLIKQDEIEVQKYAVSFLDAEKQRFLDAVEVFVAEVERAFEKVKLNVGEAEAAILSAQIAIIKDPELTKEVLRSVERQKVNVEYIFNSICNGYIALFSNLEDELMRARAADFRDIRNRMLSIMLGVQTVDLTNLPEGSILVAEDIPPSQAASINPENIRAIITQEGTKFSHIAIIARALQMPAVVAVENLLDVVHGGETIIVDGYKGKAWVNPGEAELEDHRLRLMGDRERRARLESFRERVARTADGERIGLLSNLAVPQELAVIRDHNADGVGLFRTEFLYMERKKPPSESEQYEAYKRVVRFLEGKPVVIRTLDVGGDKDIPYLYRDRELNPFLGYRAVRYCLGNHDMFKAQLAAILRAAVFGDVRILIPMITTVSELRQVRELVAEVRGELLARGKAFREDVPIGVMIETPAAAICAEELAREADFFSIGTNDLTQYVLAVDRGNGNVASLYSELHPAVLRMVEMTVRAAKKAGIKVSVCGESASDPLAIPFFLGIGVDELSVSSGFLLSVRSQLSTVSAQYWRERISTILAMETPAEVTAYIGSRVDTPQEE